MIKWKTILEPSSKVSMCVCLTQCLDHRKCHQIASNYHNTSFPKSLLPVVLLPTPARLSLCPYFSTYALPGWAHPPLRPHHAEIAHIYFIQRQTSLLSVKNLPPLCAFTRISPCLQGPCHPPRGQVNTWRSHHTTSFTPLPSQLSLRLSSSEL